MWFSGTCLNMCCVDSSYLYSFHLFYWLFVKHYDINTVASTLWHHYGMVICQAYTSCSTLSHFKDVELIFFQYIFLGGVMCENREFHLFSFVVVVTLMWLCSVIRNEPVRDSWAPCCYTTAWQELRCLNKSRPFSLFRSLLSYWLNILIRPHQALLLRGPWKSPINHP